MEKPAAKSSIQSTKDKLDKYNLQVVLDTLTAFFDISAKVVHVKSIEAVPKEFGEPLKAYRQYKKAMHDDSLQKETKETKEKNIEKLVTSLNEARNAINLKKVEELFNQIYPVLPANSSLLSFRLDLHDKWRIIRILEDYCVYAAWKDNEEKGKLQKLDYISDSFYTFVREIELFNNNEHWKNHVMIFGPFLELQQKMTVCNEEAVRKIYRFTENIFDEKNDRDIYPSEQDFLRLGSNFLSTRVDDIEEKINYFLTSLTYVYQIEYEANSEKNGLVRLENHSPEKEADQSDISNSILTKRNWIFFTLCAMFIAKYSKVVKFGTEFILYHTFQEKSDNTDYLQSELKAIIINNEATSLRFQKAGVSQKNSSGETSNTDYSKRYFALNPLSFNLKFFLRTKSKFKHLFNSLAIHFFSNKTDEVEKVWEQNFISYIQKTLTSISQNTNNKTTIIEDYLQSNWQEYLSDENKTYSTFCRWISLILRGGDVHMYEYDYHKDILPTDKKYSYATETGTTPEPSHSVQNQTSNHLKNLIEVNALSKGERIEKAIIYRCLYEKDGQYVPTVNAQNKDDINFIRNDDNSRSAIAHSLVYQGRALGVIELQGKVEYFFRSSNLYKLNKLAIFFGEYFYRIKAHKNLQEIMIKSGEVNTPITERFNYLAEMISGLFLAKAAGIWIRNESAKSYQLKGFFGEDKLRDKLAIEPQSLSFMEHGESLGAQHLRKRSRIEDIEKKRAFFEDQKYKSQTSALQAKLLNEAELNRIMIFAVDDRNIGADKPPLAVITIHNKKEQTHFYKYLKVWQKDVAYISEFIASALKIMNIQEEGYRERQAKVGHDLRTQAGQIRSSLERITRIIDGNYKKENQLNFIKFIVENDLKPLSRQTIALIQEVFAKDKQSETSKELVIKGVAALAQSTRDKKGYANLRLAYNKAIENLREHQYNKNTLVQVKVTEEIGNWRVNIAPDHLNTIFINIIENAYKYSANHSEVEVSCTEEYGALIFIMTNLGKAMNEPQEAMKVFSHEFRGTNAMAMEKKDGKGLGLWRVHSIMEAYGADIDFKVLPYINKNLNKYQIVLTFYDYKEL